MAPMLRGHGAVVVGQSIQKFDAGAFPRRVGAAANRSDETRDADVHAARRGRENCQTDLQTHFRGTRLGAFCGKMRRVNYLREFAVRSRRNSNGVALSVVFNRSNLE
jgi:hypothetical protein